MRKINVREGRSLVPSLSKLLLIATFNVLIFLSSGYRVSASDDQVTQQQQHVVKGTVTDKTKKALPGVTVYVKGTTNGTTTDFEGNYSLSVKKGDVLIFSFIGMQDQEVTVVNQTKLDIEMADQTEKLDEVVVVAFGTQKKESVVGSISTVNPGELKTSSSNLTTALSGRIAGVISYQTSGEPGRDNAQFFVRGITTFAQGAKPLILIDGVELTADDLARISPDDIESFSVLKDATSTAVYGARGANGIILVTTKKGHEGKPRISLRMENSFSSNINEPKLADPITFMNNYNEAVRTRTPGAVLPFSQEKIYNTINGVNSEVFPQTDWQKEMIKDVAVNQKMNLSVRGGGKVAQYYFSANFNKDNGILKDDPRGLVENNIDLKRYGVRSNISVNLSKSTKATFRVNATRDEYKGPAVPASSLFTYAMRTSPVRFAAVYKPDELHKNSPNVLFGSQKINDGYFLNPYQQLVSGYQEWSRSLSSLQFEISQDLDMITEGLRFRILGNNNRTSFYSLSRNTRPFLYYADELFYNPVDNSYMLEQLNENGDRALQFAPGGSNVTNVFYSEAALNFDRTFGDNTVSAMLVAIARESTNSAAKTLDTSLPQRNLGLSGRFTYDYKTKYFLEFNFGYNGSERFDKDNRFGFFPSVGAGWLVSSEPFFSGVSKNFISRLKVRGSYGIVGNDAIGSNADRFFYISEVNNSASHLAYTFGEGSSARTVNGISVLNYANPNITWEEAKTLNLGIEMYLFNDGIKVTGEYFRQKRDNILQTRLTPFSLGLESQNRDNVGKAITDGIDIAVDGNKSLSSDMWVSVRGNFTLSDGRYEFYEEPNYDMRNAPHRGLTGIRIGQRIGYVAERLFIDEEDVANSPTQYFGAAPMGGDIKYVDINKDGEISDLDRVAIGDPGSPQVTYGFGFSFGYKNFDLSAFFQGNANTSIYVDPAANAPFIQRHEGDAMGMKYFTESQLLKEFADDHWTEANRNSFAMYPRLSTTPIANNNQVSTWWLRDGSFIRFKQLELGYNFRNIRGITNLRLYASGTNLATWSKFKLWDPEVGGNGFNYPLQRVFNVGLLINL
ncbi:TonB-dependent receptor [Puteibacter caeruleilacunae]|nr:TonB-dependent receptor [Puteibacter caeruleilacunae]